MSGNVVDAATTPKSYKNNVDNQIEYNSQYLYCELYLFYMELKSKILFIVTVILICVTIAATYQRFFIHQDFESYYEEYEF